MTSTNPTTEMTVSMTDHDLIVSPTVRPKYSLTSQKPASLTWLKNSEPAADREDEQREVWLVEAVGQRRRRCRRR